jgi:hypothetical protein
LRRDNTDRFADFDRSAHRQIASVTFDTDSATRFAGQSRANANTL